MRIYMDNAATSFPKPPSVIESMINYMNSSGASVSRSSSSQATATSDSLFELREVLCDFFGGDDSRNVVFTKNITEALNIMVSGLIHKGDPVLISSLEHNATIRPLTRAGAILLPIPVSSAGIMDMEFVRKNISGVKALFCLHGSNITGDIMPIEELGLLCRQHQVPFIVDTAQTAGLLPLHMKKMHIDALCFTGHKALLGPTGTGGLVLTREIAKQIPPFITGGSGSFSDSPEHPMVMPDKLEAGTPNIVGLIGLLAALQYIQSNGREQLFRQETQMGCRFYEMLSSLPQVTLIGSADYSNKPPVFSLDFHTKDNGEVSYRLATDHHMDNRSGLHCAPMAHQTYGTYPQGTVRLSLSHFTTAEELEIAYQAIQSIQR